MSLCLALSVWEWLPVSAVAGTTLRIPLRLHIVRDLAMRKDGVTMNSWVTARHVRHTVLPEVNRIWEQAGITFELADVSDSPSLHPPDRDALIASIVRAHRNADGRSDPARIRSLERLVDVSPRDAGVIDIYLVPYLGEASQGNTRRRLRRIFVGEWSDKSSHARRPP